jgi:23S rRNA (adenine2503-C2)-methyltransferase
MGMGEPLQNYEQVLKSIRILNHPAGKNIGIRHLTVSTCGIVPEIQKLAGEDIHPRLSISLNAPTDILRGKLMPINAKYPLSQVLSAAKFYLIRAKQRVTFEYVLIKGVNDTTVYAQMLAKRFKGSAFSPRDPLWRVNLIEYNSHSGCPFVASSRERIERFSEVLEKAGIKTTVRLKLGQSINAACGQLGADWT